MRQHNHIPDEELILRYYDESARLEAIDEALATSTDLARRYAELRQVLDRVELTELPARSDLYGHEVWKRVYPRLGRRRSAQRPRVIGWAVAASLVVVMSFWIGRQTAPRLEEPTALSETSRQRILLVAIANHLERTQFVLLELANSDGAEIGVGGIDAARQLKAESRLFRQAAERSGENEIAFVLDELERFLTELSHLDRAAASDLDDLLLRFQNKNLLFKVHVLGSQLEERTRAGESAATT